MFKKINDLDSKSWSYDKHHIEKNTDYYLSKVKSCDELISAKHNIYI